MSSDQSEAGPPEDMGPIDYVVVEFPSHHTAGEGLPLFVDLVDRGIVRILDLAFVRKEVDGTVYSLNLGDVGPGSRCSMAHLPELLNQEDLDNAAEAIAPEQHSCPTRV